MSRHVVTVTLKNNQAACDPDRVEVAAGDVVQWTCERGSLAVDFEDDTPFTKIQVWAASAGGMTPDAVVQAGLPSGQTYRPTISISGAVVAEALGDIIIE